MPANLVAPPPSDLLDQMYCAAGDDLALEAVLQRIASLLRSDLAAIHEYDFRIRRGRAVISAGLAQGDASAYESHYSRISPWMLHGREQIRPGAVIVSHELYPDEKLPTTEYHAGFLSPLDLFYSIGAVTSLGPTTMSTVTVLRSRRQGCFEEAERRFVASLLPHFQALVRFHLRIGDLTRERSAALGALDRMATAVVLFDARGRVVTTNSAARDIFAQNDGLALVGDRLTASLPLESRRLAAMVAAAVAPASSTETADLGPITITRPSGGRPFAITVAPLRGAASLGGPEGVRAAAFATDTEREPWPTAEVFGRIWRLTPAEARLALSLARGTELADAADRLGISIETARTHLKRLFAKTGTSRQAALVHCLLTSLPDLRSG